MREDIDLCNFTAGELSPKLYGRTDYERYFNGCATLLNMVALPQGGATRRPGTFLAGLSKDQLPYDGGAKQFRSRLQRFVFSTVQAYMTEWTAGNVRIYANDGVVLNGSNPVDVTVPYQTGDLAALSFVQSADTLFITHPNYPPATLTRSSNTSWTYSASALRDGPYLPVNTTTTTLSCSQKFGTCTVTASSTAGINNGQGFLATDVGRLLRIRLFSLWAWLVIATRVDATHVTATFQPWMINNGAWGTLDGFSWAANTRYIAGVCVFNNGLVYICTSAGISGNGHGPNGTGSNILDGSVIWSLAGPFNATGYTANTIYACGDIIQNPPATGTYYECIEGGNVGDTGGPTGTGNNIVVNRTVWMDVAPFAFPTATPYWMLGKYSTTTGYPYLCTFWQGRLAFLGTPNQPNAVEASVSNDFTNFAPTQADNSVSAANALSWLINDDQVNAPRWVTPAGSSVAMQLGIGTSDGETVMQPATNSLALSPTNVQVYRETSQGGAPGVPALRIGKSTLFANRPGRKLFDWIWQWAVNGFVPIDRTVDADHMTLSNPPRQQGIVMVAWQQQPYSLVWCVKADGSLVALTYMPDQKVIAWHRHRLGGQYYGAPPVVESIAVIPAPDGSYDELWLTVVRGRSDLNGGAPYRTVEVMSRFFDSDLQENACFMDCALASQVTVQNGGTLDLAHIYDNGRLHSSGPVFDTTSIGALVRANGGVIEVTGLVTAYIATVAVLVPPVDLAQQAAGQWNMTPQSASFPGFPSQLIGETVQVLGDGADCGTATIDATGTITLGNGLEASYAVAGLPASYDLVTMPWAPARAALPATGKPKRLTKLYLRLFQSLGCEYGTRYTDELGGNVEQHLDTLPTRSSGDALGEMVPLQSGIWRLELPSSEDLEGQIEITGSGPFPCTVLSIGASATVGAS